MKSLNKIFYIYNEAAFAVFIFLMALLELACGIVVNNPFTTAFAFGASALFTVWSLAMALYVYYKAKRDRVI